MMGALNGLGISLQPMISAGNVITWALIAGVIAAWWIRGMPERTRAETEAKKVTGDQYAEQIKDFRKEVHGYRNDLHMVQRALAQAESLSRQRADRIANLTFIVELLISEVKRLDEDSIILRQAEVLMKRMKDDDPDEEPAVVAARETVRAAEKTEKLIERGAKE